MRIRDSASRVLGSEYFDVLRSPPNPAPRLELQAPRPPLRPARPHLWHSESHAGGDSFAAGASSELLCNTSQSVSSFEVQHDLSDLKDVDFVNRTYYAGVDVPVGRLIPTSKGQCNVVQNKATESEPKKKVMLESEEEKDVAAGGAEQVIWRCKKSDGRRWFCKRPVSKSNSLCSYHAKQKRLAAPPAPPAGSNPSMSLKLASKRKAVDSYEPYIYYDGFGPSRSKRC